MGILQLPPTTLEKVQGFQVPKPGIRLPPDDPFLHPLNNTYGDEFNAATLDAAWTKRNIAQAEVFVPKTTYFSAGLQLVFDAQGDAIYRPAPAGDFEIVCTCTGDEFGGMTGLAIIDTLGTGVGFSPYNDGNTYSWSMLTYNYTASGFSINNGPVAGQVYHIALKKVGTGYTGRYSVDGVNWSATSSTLTSLITVDRIGFARIFTAGGTAGTFTIHRYNVYPSPYYIP